MKILPTLNIQNGMAIPIAGEAAAGEGGTLVPGDPAFLVAFLMDHGCHRLALVDVDAARGRGNNRELIARLMQKFHAGRPKVCIQVGGGIRSSDQAQFFLDHGAIWLAVGTILQRSPLLVDQLLARFREHLTAAVDARAGEVLASGWGDPSGQKLVAVGERIRNHGFKRLLFMDIPLEAGAAPDFAGARILAESSHLPVYMGGSIRTLAELAQAREHPGLQGVVMDALLLHADPALPVSLKLSCG